MKTGCRIGALVVLAWVALWAAPSFANTFGVVNSGATAYVINGASNPNLTLYRGRTYTFNLSASGHPFWIKTVQGTGTGNAFTSGVTGNGTSVGTLTFAVPTNAPATLFYNCQFHASMRGVLTIQDSPQRGWWRFEDVSTNVLDFSGSGLHGSVEEMNGGPDNGVTGFSSDVPGSLVVDGNLTNANLRSLRFAKGPGRVRILDPSRFDITNTASRLSVEAFVKFTSTGFPMRILDAVDTSDPGVATWISPFLSAFSPAPLLAITIQSDATTNFYTTFASPAVDPSPLAFRQWHHVAFVQDGGTSKFYVNYQLVSQGGFPTFTPGTFTNINQLTLGAIAGQSDNTFHGLLDEIRVTDGALAPTQFLRVANGLAPGFRSIQTDGLATRLSMVTESGVFYRVQAATNLLAAPPVWSDVGGLVTGRLFYTSITNADSAPRFYRAVRTP